MSRPSSSSSAKGVQEPAMSTKMLEWSKRLSIEWVPGDQVPRW